MDGGGEMWFLDRWPEALRFPIEPGADNERGFLTYAAARAAGHL